MHMLGDAIPGGNTDTLYTGDTGDSLLSMQHWRNTVSQFQETLNAIDTAAQAAQAAIDADIDDDLSIDMFDALQQIEAKKWQFRSTAQAINAASSVVNAAGGRFPVLSIPSTLGLLPIVLPAAGIAAVAIAVTLIAWGIPVIQGINDRLRLAEQLGAVTDPDKKAALANAIATSDASVRQTNGSMLGNLGSIIKWGAIALGAFLAFQVFQSTRKGRR